MKKLPFFVIAFLSFIGSASANSFVYPLDQIAKPECRYSPWSTLDDTCKMKLPRITLADYASYKDNKDYRRIYSVLW